MSSNDFNTQSDTQSDTPLGRSRPHFIWAAGTVLSLMGNGYLLMRDNSVSTDLAQLQEKTQTQIAALSQAASASAQDGHQRLDLLSQEVKDQIQGANRTAIKAVERARSEVRRHVKEFDTKLEEQKKEQQQAAVDLAEVKETASATSSKLTEVGGDVSQVKSEVASAHSELQKTGSDLKRVMGDLGVMSGLIATNSRQLTALRELGERNYIEFDVQKTGTPQRIADINLVLKKADPKRNRYTVEILADDKRVEKRDRTINEPVQLYVSGNRLPYEIVVNEVKKGQITGYLATPKVTVARR